MAVQYSGGPIVNATFTATTRLSIVDNLKNQLVNANWTATGSSGDWVVTSASTPQSLQACVRLIDPGSGNCATVTVRNAGGSLISTGKLFVYPSGNDFRIIANPYQFFMMEDNAPTATNRRDFAACGCPWVPTFPLITEAIWSSSRCWNDGTNAGFTGFREALTHNSNITANTANYTTILNGSMYEVVATALSNDPGILSLRVGHSADFCADSIDGAAGVGSGTTWFDGTILMDTPYLVWAQADATTDTGTINGVMWDAVVVEGAYNYGDTFTFDSKTWFAITHSNTPASGDNNPGGTLFVRTT